MARSLGWRRSPPVAGDVAAPQGAAQDWIRANLTPAGFWLAALVTIVFALPGPIDRALFAVNLGREVDATPGAIFSITDLLLIGTVAFASPQLLRRWRTARWTEHAPIIALFATVVVLAFISLAQAAGHIPSDQLGAGIKGAVIFVRMGLIFLCVTLIVRSPIDLRGLAIGLVLATGGLLANGLLFTYQHRAVLDRLTAGTFGNDLYANLLAVIALLLAGFVIVLWSSRLIRLVAAAATLACVAAIAGTGTRTAAIVFIVGLGGLAALLHSVKGVMTANKRRWFLLLIAAFFVSQLYAVLLLRSSALLGLLLGQALHPSHVRAVPEVASRLAIWGGTLRMVHDHLWLGVGPGQWDFFRHAYGVNFIEFLDAHNAYLNILADDGVFVLVGYLSIIGVSLWRGLRTLQRLLAATQRRAGPLIDAALLGILAVGIAAWLVTDFANSGALNLRAQIFYWLMLALFYRAPEIFLSDSTAAEIGGHRRKT